MNSTSDEKWLHTISSKRSVFDLNLKEIWRYRDLLVLFVKRDIVTVYKQTILGPLWFLIQPLFTSVMFTLIFNRLAKLDTAGIPPLLFNLAGITAWNYFKTSLTGTSSTFTSNAGIFGKVYFPRAIVPFSKVISNLLKFGIQLLILVIFYVIYYFQGYKTLPDWHVILLLYYIFLMALYGLGLGMLITTLTTKYRDFSIILSFATQLLMYISAVPFTMSEFIEKQPEYAWIMQYNPIAHIIEGFRFVIFNSNDMYFSWEGLFFVSILGIVLFVLGLAIFNRTEKNFIDTV